MTKMDKDTAKKAARTAILAGLFVVSFIFFMVMTFPYEVLKESIAANVSKATGFTVEIGDMAAALPLGIRCQKVRIEGAGQASAMEFKSLAVKLSVLRLLLGQVGVTVEATAGKGELNLGLNFGILDLAAQSVMPRRITLDSKGFPLDQAISFALNNAASSPGANPMVAPLLSAIGISAQLNGTADFSLDVKTPTQSSGQADIQLANAVLKLSHPSLGLPDQRFKKASFKAKMENGSIVVDKSSAFIADELELLADGKITLKPQAGASLLDLKIVFKLTNGLKDKLGFVIDGVTGNPNSDGVVTTQVRGTLDQPQTMNL